MLYEISRILKHLKQGISLSHPSLGWQCFQFVSATAALTFASHIKPFELNLRYLGQRKYRSVKMYWMTLTQGHSCDIDKQKFACLQDKVRTTQLITTKFDSYIPLVMGLLIFNWIDFRGILLETFFCQIFFENFGCVFSRSKTLLDISQECSGVRQNDWETRPPPGNYSTASDT